MQQARREGRTLLVVFAHGIHLHVDCSCAVAHAVAAAAATAAAAPTAPIHPAPAQSISSTPLSLVLCYADDRRWDNFPVQLRDASELLLAAPFQLMRDNPCLAVLRHPPFCTKGLSRLLIAHAHLARIRQLQGLTSAVMLACPCSSSTRGRAQPHPAAYAARTRQPLHALLRHTAANERSRGSSQTEPALSCCGTSSVILTSRRCCCSPACSAASLHARRHECIQVGDGLSTICQ